MPKINIVLTDKTGPLFLEFNWCNKSLLRKIANAVTLVPLSIRLTTSLQSTATNVAHSKDP